MESAGGVHHFVEAFYRHRDRYRVFARRYVRSESVAEQIMDDCLLRLWERREQIEAATIESYFYASLKFGCLNYLRDRQRQREIEHQIYDRGYRLRQHDIASLDSLDTSHIFSREIRDIMYRELEALPERTRSIFLDSRFKALNHDQIAGKYDLPKFKVCREIESVVKRLRVALRDYLPALLAAAAIMQH